MWRVHFSGVWLSCFDYLNLNVKKIIFLDLFILHYVYECLFACAHVCVAHVPVVSPGIRATIWGLGMEPRSSTGVASALTL